MFGRSRDRFWAEDKQAVEKTRCVLDALRMLDCDKQIDCSVCPFLAETMWQNLAGVYGGRATKSVHLCDYPLADVAKIDHDLSVKMATLREIASLGRAARAESKLKVRQPLSKVEVILVEPTNRKLAGKP